MIERNRKNTDVRPSSDTLERELHRALRRARYAEEAVQRIRQVADHPESVRSVIAEYDAKADV